MLYCNMCLLLSVWYDLLAVTMMVSFVFRHRHFIIRTRDADALVFATQSLGPNAQTMHIDDIINTWIVDSRLVNDNILFIGTSTSTSTST